MKIKILNYYLMQNDMAKAMWDLHETGRREFENKKTGEVKEKDYDTIVAYGVRLSRAIDIITNNKILNEEEKTLIDFVSEKIYVMETLLKKFDNFTKILKENNNGKEKAQNQN
jgi:hypothetical protein